MWRLIRVSTVCLQNILLKFGKKWKNTTQQPLQWKWTGQSHKSWKSHSAYMGEACHCDQFSKTVNLRKSSHPKIDKTKILMANGSLMKVKTIAECSPLEHSAILLTCIKPYQFSVFLRVVVLHRFYFILTFVHSFSAAKGEISDLTIISKSFEKDLKESKLKVKRFENSVFNMESRVGYIIFLFIVCLC